MKLTFSYLPYVFRGGSWWNVTIRFLWSSYRGRDEAWYKDRSLGLRCVLPLVNLITLLDDSAISNLGGDYNDVDPYLTERLSAGPDFKNQDQGFRCVHP